MKIIALYGKGRTDKRSVAEILVRDRGCVQLRMEDIVIDIIRRQNPVIAASGSKVQSLLDRYGVEHCLTKYKELREIVSNTTRVLQDFFGKPCLLNLLSHDKIQPIATENENAVFVISDFEDIELLTYLRDAMPESETWYVYKEFSECDTAGIDITKKLVSTVSLEKLTIATLAAFDGEQVKTAKNKAKPIN